MGLAGTFIAWRLANQEFGVTPLIQDVVGAAAIIAFLTISAGYILARNDDRHSAARHADYRDCRSFGQDPTYSPERQATLRLNWLHARHDDGRPNMRLSAAKGSI